METRLVELALFSTFDSEDPASVKVKKPTF